MNKRRAAAVDLYAAFGVTPAQQSAPPSPARQQPTAAAKPAKRSMPTRARTPFDAFGVETVKGNKEKRHPPVLDPIYVYCTKHPKRMASFVARPADAHPGEVTRTVFLCEECYTDLQRQLEAIGIYQRTRYGKSRKGYPFGR